MTSTPSTGDNLTKFQNLLRELFQFDCADLDFGIYRIMNHKRDVVEQFITQQLPDHVATELDSGPLVQEAQAKDSLAETAKKVRAALGESAIDDDGHLAERHHELPIGKEYLEAQARAADRSRSRAAVEADIYNHLYAFFSRYYDEGDFISQRRYSRNQRYAIPYNGEEVYLHWANSDQYYVKSDEHFRNYDWQAPNGVAVHFRLKNADVEQNNVKGDRRFFLPIAEDTRWDAEQNVVEIPFEYRPLSAGETAAYGGRNQQDKIVERALDAIPQQLNGNLQATTALADEHRRNGNGPVSRLEHHLCRYVRRNNSDFFVHKDLSGFLNRELDFYLKNEVLNLDNLVAAGREMAETRFQQLRLAKQVGSKIIDFLAQIEDFQKLLWEKRKFVTETHYCITLGCIDPRFYPDIAANDAQWAEWAELMVSDGSDRSAAFLETHPTLMLDTRHFAADFTDRLLASFADLDEMTDGLLVHGDNWQALNLLDRKYVGRVSCIYIDPPYNTDTSEILYKNGYKDSTWIAMMRDRVLFNKGFLTSGGFNAVTIDHVEFHNLAMILDQIFGKEQHIGTVSVLINPKGRQHEKFFSKSTEYMLVHCNDLSVARFNQVAINSEKAQTFILSDGQRRYRLDPFARIRNSTTREIKPDAYYPIYVSPDLNELTLEPKVGYVAVYPTNDQGKEFSWKVEPETFAQRLKQGDYVAERDVRGKLQIFNKYYENQVHHNFWHDKKYFPEFNGTQLLKALFGDSSFSYPKSVYAVSDTLKLLANEQTFVLDYFAGSGTTGHAVINLNREDGGQRRFILVEMGEYFDTVLLPRIKKVTFTPEWRDGKPQRPATAEEAERSPRVVKYHRLESYEDALDSIRFDAESGQIPLSWPGDEYLLKYMLDWETKDSETLLNPARLTAPFAYRLVVQVKGERQERRVDLPETFNYLLGLQSRQREVHDNEGRRYLVYRGEMRANPGQTVAVIWRATEGWTEADFAADRDFVAAANLAGDAATVYVNGGSCIPGAKPIEPMFKARMFAAVNL